MQICTVFTTIVNYIRGFSLWLTVGLVVGLIIVGLLTFKKSIKVNYNPKNVDKVNFAWFFLVIVIFALATFISLVYFGSF